jgi:hypothetical protein
MKKITIEWLEDTYECEDCGMSWAEGAIVKLDGEVILEMLPLAHCYGGANYTKEDVYGAILVELGYDVEEL